MHGSRRTFELRNSLAGPQGPARQTVVQDFTAAGQLSRQPGDPDCFVVTLRGWRALRRPLLLATPQPGYV
jgi:hypothetical protein